MPQFLKSVTIDLLKGSIEMYRLALIGLGLPKGGKGKEELSRYAPIISLLGTSTELIVKSIIVQGLSLEEIYINKNIKEGKFVNISQLLKQLEAAVKNNCEWVANLLNESSEKSLDRTLFLQYLAKIRMLQNLRSLGLHAGKGCSRDVAMVIANEIYGLFSFLSKLKRYKSYLKNIPSPEPLVRDREVIIEDLKRRVKQDDVESTIDYISNLFLVLPYIPEDAPKWLDDFENIKVANPSLDDIAYFVKTLEHAHSISFLKGRGGKSGYLVRIDNSNPDALPISVERLKRKLTNPSDIFCNAVAAANTRLEKGQIDLPCKDHLIELFDTSIEDVTTDKDEMLTAEQAWPFLVAAVSYQGTPLPCFQFIRYCDELQKLKTFILRAEKFGNGYLKNRVDTLLLFLDSKINNTPVIWNNIPNNSSNRVFRDIISFSGAYGKSNSEGFNVEFLKNMVVNDVVAEIIEKYLSGNVKAGDAIREIIIQGDSSEAEKKIIAKLLDNCNDFSNRKAFKPILDNVKLQSLHTIARKKMFFVDFFYNFLGENNIEIIRDQLMDFKR